MPGLTHGGRPGRSRACPLTTGNGKGKEDGDVQNDVHRASAGHVL